MTAPSNIAEPNVQPGAPVAPPATATEAELVLARFRVLARRRTAWLQELWREEGERGGRLAVTHAEIAAHLADRDSPAAEAERLRSASEAAMWEEELAQIEVGLAESGPARLAHLAQVFGLSAAESDLLQCCLAVALDPSLARVCAYLQDHAGRPFVTEEFAARLYGHGRCGMWSASSPLFRYELIDVREGSAGEPRALLCDPQIRDWVLGRSGLDETLVGLAQVAAPCTPLASWPIGETAEFVQRVLDGNGPSRVRVRLSGARGSGRRTFAAVLCAQLGLPLLVIETDAIDDANWRRVFMRAQRHAYLQGCALAWTGESVSRRPWPHGLPPFPVQFVICEPGQELPPAPGVIERNVTLPVPATAEREALWLEHLPLSKTWPQKDLRELVEQHRFLPGDIASAGNSGAGDARQASRHARESSRAHLGQLAQRLECPFTPDDLVVSDHLREILRDIEFEARHRLPFWDRPEAQRLFPQGRGLLALFSGPPGTGKTMAAQVLAAGLDYDLYRINLATVVSKWVGETSQNLERILTRAAGMDAILLFDEADALFSKRASEVRDAQDRFANTDTAYLLQAIESYPGIALLTSNQKKVIDPAFLRRLRFVIEFPKPDVAQQEQLWYKAIEGLAGAKTLESCAPVLPMLARSVEATGAQIKNAVLGALFIAQREKVPLSPSQLLRGLEREISKEGRGLGPSERERILRHAK